MPSSVETTSTHRSHFPGEVTGDSGESDGSGLALGAALPAALIVLLLLLATWWEGAFDLQDWAPLAAFALLALAALVANGGAVLPRGWAVAGMAGIWGLAAWGLLSTSWSDSAALSLEGATRNALYAALVTLPLTAIPGRREVRLVGWALVGGLGAIALVTLGPSTWSGRTSSWPVASMPRCATATRRHACSPSPSGRS